MQSLIHHMQRHWGHRETGVCSWPFFIFKRYSGSKFRPKNSDAAHMERTTCTHPLDWIKDSKGWKKVAKGTREDMSAGRTAYPALTLESELWAQQGLKHIHPSINSFI